MKRLLALICGFAFLLAGCTAGSVPSFPPAQSAPAVSPAPASTAAPQPRPTPDDPDEARMLAMAEEAAGAEMPDSVCLDLDGDGTKEFLGVCHNSASQCNEVWYCGGDGTACAAVHRDTMGLDACSLEALKAGNGFHVAVNSHVGLGTTSLFSILALQAGQIVCLVDNQPGNVWMTEEGDITLSVEAYDGAYDAAGDFLLLHTVKDTYIFYDGETYKEYGAAELSEEEFSRLKNADELKARIEHSLRFEEYDRLEYRYFLRSNGILQVQCDLYDTAGNIQYGYFTARWLGDEVDPELIGRWEPGQMAASLSTLDAVY